MIDSAGMEIRDEGSLIEAMARSIGTGLPPMAGRMWAYLIICEPPEQTAAEIADRLQASRGSVSSMARLLEHAGLIRRGTRPGDRRERFSVSADVVENVMAPRIHQLRAARQTLDAGLELLADRPPGSRERLQSLRDMYAFFETEWPSTMERLRNSRARESPKERKDVTR
ncbi:MAG TPA: MarR family transcriptional regulator [Candidatus Limnocylindria bacterium]|nr:MarR family transcriptional regulator [Candidatus Limnocylindria bacterium]